MAVVGIVMGSDSDLEVMKPAAEVLKEFGVEYDIAISSAHRLPRETARYAETAAERGLDVIIAGAGGAAHLAGVIAALTVLPVIGVPIKTSTLSGIDSLYSMVQMPRGIPVATVGINASANAALLALAIIGIKSRTIQEKLFKYRRTLAEEVRTKNLQLQKAGIDGYLSHKGGEPVIERYILPDMGQVWSEENKLSNWLRIELLACEGWARLGRIPASALRVIKANASFEVKRVREIESEVRHDVIAFLTNVAEQVGEESRYIHMGMTSSDVLDTGLALQMREAADLILDKLERLQAVIGRQAGQHKYTLMVGRTHGVHAEPTTFGLKMALWYTEMKRNQERIARAREVISYGKISGAVGTFANIDPAVEEYVCHELGLKPCPVSTQIIQRDRQAEFMAALAVVASSVEKMAVEIRNLQRTDIREVEEPFYPGQKGSSAMPHKRNPMISERVTGLARVVRSNALAAMENVALWHERDLTHSSVERVIIPDSCILLDYILDKFKTVMENLVVYPDHMRTNLDKTSGLIFSQRVMLGLVERGMTREEAYRLVQKNSMQAWNQGIALQELVAQDPEIAKYLDDKALQNIFDYTSYTRQVDYVFRRCGLEPG